MEVVRAETAGFCMGVDIALNKLDSLLESRADGDTIHILGPIIHNPQVLERYAAKGVHTAKAAEDVKSGEHCVIRAHGIPHEVESTLRDRGVTVLDATCPRVKKAQTLIARQCNDGRKLLLYGESDHPEVKGLLSYANADAVVFDQTDELDINTLDTSENYVLAAQTTQDREAFDILAKALMDHPDIDAVVLHTICDATNIRQEEAMSIAKEVDCMVVVGGRMSGNTRRLVQVCEFRGARCYHVETPAELPEDDLTTCQRIGLTAGASTPPDLIDAVEDVLRAL